MVDRLGVVLAGGRSSRFGSDKFLHPIDGVELGVLAIRLLQPVVDRVLVVGRHQLSPTWGAEDLFGPREGSGPLGAILDASEAADSRYLVTVPCDMPNLTSSSIAELVRVMTSSDVDCVFARPSNGEEAQWLTACWNGASVRDRVGALYGEGIRSVKEVAGRIRHTFVDLPPEELVNLNTPVSS